MCYARCRVIDTMTQHIPAALTVILVAAAVYTDVRWERIPNWVSAPLALAGLVAATALGGVEGLIKSLEGLGVGLLLFLLSALFGRLLGGGDIKLLMAVGAINGPIFLIWTIVYMAVFGGVLAVVVSLVRRDLKASLSRLGGGLLMRAFAREKMDLKDTTPAGKLPYAIPIALGSLLATVFVYMHDGVPGPPWGG